MKKYKCHCYLLLKSLHIRTLDHHLHSVERAQWAGEGSREAQETGEPQRQATALAGARGSQRARQEPDLEGHRNVTSTSEEIWLEPQSLWLEPVPRGAQPDTHTASEDLRASQNLRLRFSAGNTVAHTQLHQETGGFLSSFWPHTQRKNT